MIKIISHPIIIQIDKLPNKIPKNIPKNIKSSEIVNSSAYIINKMDLVVFDWHKFVNN